MATYYNLPCKHCCHGQGEKIVSQNHLDFSSSTACDARPGAYRAAKAGTAIPNCIFCLMPQISVSLHLDFLFLAAIRVSSLPSSSPFMLHRNSSKQRHPCSSLASSSLAARLCKLQSLCSHAFLQVEVIHFSARSSLLSVTLLLNLDRFVGLGFLGEILKQIVACCCAQCKRFLDVVWFAFIC